MQACHDQENQISYRLSLPLTDLTDTLTSALRDRKLGGDVPDELKAKVKSLNDELFKVRHDLYYTDFWGDEGADRGGKKGSRERQKAANLAFSAWGAPIARFFVIWCMNCICETVTNPPPSPAAAPLFSFKAMLMRWWAEATMQGRQLHFSAECRTHSLAHCNHRRSLFSIMFPAHNDPSLGRT